MESLSRAEIDQLARDRNWGAFGGHMRSDSSYAPSYGVDYFSYGRNIEKNINNDKVPSGSVALDHRVLPNGSIDLNRYIVAPEDGGVMVLGGSDNGHKWLSKTGPGDEVPDWMAPRSLSYRIDRINSLFDSPALHYSASETEVIEYEKTYSVPLGFSPEDSAAPFLDTVSAVGFHDLLGGIYEGDLAWRNAYLTQPQYPPGEYNGVERMEVQIARGRMYAFDKSSTNPAGFSSLAPWSVGERSNGSFFPNRDRDLIRSVSDDINNGTLHFGSTAMLGESFVKMNALRSLGAYQVKETFRIPSFFGFTGRVVNSMPPTEFRVTVSVPAHSWGVKEISRLEMGDALTVMGKNSKTMQILSNDYDMNPLLKKAPYVKYAFMTADYGTYMASAPDGGVVQANIAYGIDTAGGEVSAWGAAAAGAGLGLYCGPGAWVCSPVAAAAMGIGAGYGWNEWVSPHIRNWGHSVGAPNLDKQLTPMQKLQEQEMKLLMQGIVKRRP
jgi:hypothetical protein